MSKIDIHYQEVSLSHVVDHFVKDFELREGTTLSSHDFFFDVLKNKLVLRLFVEKPESNEDMEPQNG